MEREPRNGEQERTQDDGTPPVAVRPACCTRNSGLPAPGTDKPRPLTARPPGCPAARAQAADWVLSAVRAEWEAPELVARLASPDAFLAAYLPVEPDPYGGHQVRT